MVAGWAGGGERQGATGFRPGEDGNGVWRLAAGRPVSKLSRCGEVYLVLSTLFLDFVSVLPHSLPNVSEHELKYATDFSTDIPRYKGSSHPQ